ncbi:MAG: GNAT family N-acetyltransferase [Actinomycetes bacterium]
MSQRPSILVGPRVRLRPPRPGDAEGRRRLGYHPEVERGHGRLVQTHRTLTSDEARAWYEHLATAAPHAWVVEASGYLAGWAALHDLDCEDRRARYEVGLLHPAYLDLGLGTETTRLVLMAAFDVLGLHRVDARVLSTNDRALAVLEGCGFTQEGRTRESCHVGGVWLDHLLLGVLEDEYRARAEAWPEAGPAPRRGPDTGPAPQANAK